jgi:hypothetical protein
VFLSGVASRLQKRFTDSFVQKINQVSGFLIAGFGIIMVGSAVFLR